MSTVDPGTSSGGDASAAPPPSRGWRDLWQVPALILAMGLLAGGLVTAVRTTPEPDHAGMLDAAASMIDRQRYVEAIDHLNEHVFPYVREDQLGVELESRFHLLMARALGRGQEALGISEGENHRNVISSYRAATDAGASLTPRDREQKAMSLLALDRVEAAIDAVEPLGESERSRRSRVYRRAIEGELSDGGDVERASELLSWFLADPAIAPAQRAWAVAQQAGLMLDQEYHEDAIAKLLREIQRLREAPPDRLAELFLLLARAYMETGAIDNASDQLQRAESMLDERSPRMAPVHLNRGRIAERRGNPERARELYRLVSESFSHTPEQLPALLELGEIEGSLGRTAAALDAFRKLGVELDAGRTHRGVSRSIATGSVLERCRDLRHQGELEAGLEFARLAESYYPRGERPARVIRAMAESHRALAEELLEVERADGGLRRRLASLDPSRRESARRHLVAAGSAYRRHADAMVRSDNEAYERSLWMAADSLDLAGDLGEAIPIFQEYIRQFPDESRQAEARFRLGRAHQARGDYELAGEVYRGLIEDGNDPQVKQAGLYADRSVVPLAQVYMSDEEPSNDARAEALLRSVVEGELVVQPDTPMMRDALVELGRLLARGGQYTRAIEQFEAVLGRFPEDPAAPAIRYRLAEAYRKDADRVESRLKADLAISMRERLRTRREQRLERALGLYDRVVRELGAIPEGRRTRVEHEFLRNAHFFRGGAAFDLGQYEQAIQHYDTAFERYPEQPASLVSLVQIVNAYIEMDQLDRARVANERAQRFFESMPDDVWDRPDLPMDRGDWERWLDSTSRLYSLGQEP